MNEKEQQEYLEGYQEEKKKGIPFFPDALFKDALISLIVFFLLVALTYFLGAPLEARANPADTNYTPRPEWYFLFLFQLLKYFPGKLEVVGVVLIPTVAVVFLFLLPLLDRSPKRHPARRPGIIIFTGILIIGVVGLTIMALREAPPPLETAQGDQTAALYTKNCAPCHGVSITVRPGTDLHNIIAQGKHEGMPPWSGDLTTDQIDALAGFILSPKGSSLFNENCADCHSVEELVAGNPIDLKSALTQANAFAPHADVQIPDWNTTLSPENQTALLNFLVAPDGQRLFTINCSPCHGSSLATSGDEESIRQTISQGGMHLDMPAWKEKLSFSDVDILSKYVVNPGSVPEGKQLFEQYCASCHGERIPSALNIDEAKNIIEQGGVHQIMPVWGEILTPDQLDALVSYTLSASKGTPIELGQQLYAQSCAACHGDFGEGGANPTRPGDIIAPISSAEYLATRDDITLQSIIAQGQPNIGMSPFGTAFGGPLSDEDIDAIIAFMRSWEENPPVEVPPEVPAETPILTSDQIYVDLCSQCHGDEGQGGVGPSFQNPEFQQARSDQDIADAISKGHSSTAMIGWSDLLSEEQIQELVALIRSLEKAEAQPESTPSIPSYKADIQPIFKQSCLICHGNQGGWSTVSYESVMNSGDHAPVIVPGDPENSLLFQMLTGTAKEGKLMPPAGKLSDKRIQLIHDWIMGGAPDN